MTTPATQIAHLRKLNKPIPAQLLESHRSYHRESKNRCRKVKRLLGVRPPGRPMSNPQTKGAPMFSLDYSVVLGVGVKL